MIVYFRCRLYKRKLSHNIEEFCVNVSGLTAKKVNMSTENLEVPRSIARSVCVHFVSKENHEFTKK